LRAIELSVGCIISGRSGYSGIFFHQRGIHFVGNIFGSLLKRQAEHLLDYPEWFEVRDGGGITKLRLVMLPPKGWEPESVRIPDDWLKVVNSLRARIFASIRRWVRREPEGYKIPITWVFRLTEFQYLLGRYDWHDFALLENKLKESKIKNIKQLVAMDESQLSAVIGRIYSRMIRVCLRAIDLDLGMSKDDWRAFLQMYNIRPPKNPYR